MRRGGLIFKKGNRQILSLNDFQEIAVIESGAYKICQNSLCLMKQAKC